MPLRSEKTALFIYGSRSLERASFRRWYRAGVSLFTGGPLPRLRSAAIYFPYAEALSRYQCDLSLL